MRVLVFGKEGQVARALAEIAGDNWIFAGRHDANLAVAGEGDRTVVSLCPSLVINTAAFTDVEGAEEHASEARRLNADAAGEIALAANRIGAAIVHLSTDYVFDGATAQPIPEDAPAHPLGVYGATKFSGEQAVADCNPDHLIIRTSWIVSPFGRNFVKTMLRLAQDRDEIRVVADQVGRPTPAADLARAIVDIAEDWGKGARGVYHLAGGGEPTSWADLAEYVMAARRRLLGSAPAILSITTADYPVLARRPSHSVLDLAKAERNLGITLPDWRPGVDQIINRLLATTAK